MPQSYCLESPDSIGKNDEKELDAPLATIEKYPPLSREGAKESFLKTHIKKLFLLPALIAGLGLMPAGRATAQTFTTLHTFTAAGGVQALGRYTNNDGGQPSAKLIVLSNFLYGTAQYGGNSGNGTVFAVKTDGTVFTNLHSFTATSGNPYTNSDGGNPSAGLILSSNILYGTTYATYGGGSGGVGTVFAVNTDGTDFTNLHSFTALSYPFTNSDGAYPEAGLILSDNTLYGTAVQGGGFGHGTVFAGNINGSGFTALHSFTQTINYTNSDGWSPVGTLILSGNTLYGTAEYGGNSGNGTVFAVNTDGTGFTNLHSFTKIINYTNGDGWYPVGALILSGDTLYGMASKGGRSGNGTVFKVNTIGTGFATLYNFTALSNSRNSDGANPVAGLIVSNDMLYGTAENGGIWGYGTIFAIKTDGTGFTNLHNFTGGSDGADPDADLILSGNNFYGTTYSGGTFGNGTVFSLLFAPQLTITSSGANVILTWPTNVAGFDYTGFTLQSTTNLVSKNWSTNLPSAVVVNGQNVVTNPIFSTQKFYRLSQ